MGSKQDQQRIYSSSTVPPAASMAALSFSASSLLRPSLSTWGVDSTNFLASTRFLYQKHGDVIMSA